VSRSHGRGLRRTSLTGVLELARAGMASGSRACSSRRTRIRTAPSATGPSALPLALLEPFLEQVKAVDDLVKEPADADI
jgi:2-dehydro-3-deoxyphosphooctonate aldolase (KDO 8-P synthase)